MATFYSIMTVNLSALQEAGVLNVSCGDFVSTGIITWTNGLWSPQPSQSCAVTRNLAGILTVGLTWSGNFSSQHAVERYNVSVFPDPSSCSSDQVSPNVDYRCSGLALGTFYTFTISAITCTNLEGERKILHVHPQGPSNPTNITTRAVYYESTHNIELLVSWNDVYTTHRLPSNCVFNKSIHYNYLQLEDAANNMVVIPASTQCSNSMCSISTMLTPSNRNYSISIYSQNVFGISNRSSLPYLIAGSSHFYFKYYFIPENTSCKMLGLCSTQLSVDDCIFQYGTDSSYSNFNLPIQGPVNFPFSLPELEEFTTYYYQVSVAVEESFLVQLRGIQTTGECNMGSKDNMQKIHWYQNISFFIACCVLAVITIMLMVTSLVFLKQSIKFKTRLRETKAQDIQLKRENNDIYDEIQDRDTQKNLRIMSTVKNSAYNAFTMHKS